MINNKRAEEGILMTVIFIILNLIFFFIILIFAYNSGTQTFIYEQAYAKQIALIVDNAKPDMIVMVNIDEIAKVAEKNNRDLTKVFSVDKNLNQIRVNLGKSGGYSYSYFSDVDVQLNVNENWLSVSIISKEK